MLAGDHWVQGSLPISIGDISVSIVKSSQAKSTHCGDQQELELAESIWKNLANTDDIPSIPSQSSHQKNWDYSPGHKRL